MAACNIALLARALLALLVFPLRLSADTVHQGVAARVVDGDTFVLQAATSGSSSLSHRIRLHGVDAFELNQRCLDKRRRSYACGHDALTALQRLVEGQFVKCTPRGRSGKRIVARCNMADGSDVAGMMVRLGWAFRDRSAFKWLPPNTCSCYWYCMRDGRRATWFPRSVCDITCVCTNVAC